ncbi:unnamed protein product, partial [Scytosiphon promiscuus]
QFDERPSSKLKQEEADLFAESNVRYKKSEKKLRSSQMESTEGIVEAGSSTGSDKRERGHNGTPVLLVSIVLVISAFAWQLIGAGALVHMLVLALGILVGAFFHPRPPASTADGPATQATAAETAAETSTHAAA